MERLVRTGLLAFLLSVPLDAAAQDTEWNRYTLEDLGGVFVRMEVSEACEAAGLTASAFEADVSMALIEADVGVLTREEMLEHPALPELRVTVDCAPGSNGASGAMAYSVGLRVQQSAQMLRDTQITLPEAVTWYSSRIGVTEVGSAVQAVEATLEEQVQAFATAWTEINTEGEGG
ncbi:MAG: hypothetical protein R3304_09635 [Longimicrobiales bacterium]|nr:hypothetical protein [Longimicrobiales bacterium]